MREWIKFLNIRNSDFKILEKDSTRNIELEIEKNLELIEKYIQANNCWEILNNNLQEISIEVRLFHNDDIETNVIIDTVTKNIFIREFFYNTLVGEVLNQFKTYLIYLYISFHSVDPDIDIDLYQHMGQFIYKREIRLSEEEFNCLLLKKTEAEKDLHCKAILFLNLTHGNKLSRLSYFENKIIKEILGTFHAKRMLGLKESSYKYIEKGNTDTEEYLNEQKIFHELKEEFDTKAIDFEDYIKNVLIKKNIFFWNWWTISPFVAVDVAILLPMIYAAKKIKALWVDLPRSSEDVFNDYITNKITDDEVIENEIKKLYPPIMKDFQKETLPYMILLNKMKELNIPLHCYGKNGIELLEVEPVFVDEHLVRFPVDKEWKKTIVSYFSNIDQLDDELIIFIQFMKPMYTIPFKINDQRVEKVIHTDRFTGFGPEKPENKLSIYSRHISSTQKSFIYNNLNESPFKDDPVVFFPYTSDDMPRLDDSMFNKFYLYNTLIYSSHTGGGGNDRDFQKTDPNLFSIYSH